MAENLKWRVGDRVVIPANPKEGWPEERGVLEGIDGDCFMVRLDPVYRRDGDDYDDDGLREFDRTEARRP